MFRKRFLFLSWVHWGKFHGVPATIWSVGVVLFDLVCVRFPIRSDEELVKAKLTFSPDLFDGEKTRSHRFL